MSADYNNTSRIGAVVTFSSVAEIPFLSYSVPRLLSMFPEAHVYLFFPVTAYSDVLSQEGLQKLVDTGRVHVKHAPYVLSDMNIPVGERSLEAMLNAYSIIIAEQAIPLSHLVLRVPCFSLLSEKVYFSAPASNGCEMVLSGGFNAPFGHGAYMMSAQVLEGLLRLVSLARVDMCGNKSCDVFLQSMAFAAFNDKKFLYLQKDSQTGKNYEYEYDYDIGPEAFKQSFLSGVVRFFKPGVPVRKIMQAVKAVSSILNKPAE